MEKAGDEPLFKNAQNQDDSFYDTIETSNPEYDNALNQNQQPISLADQEQQQQEWRAELAKLEEEISTLRTVLGAKVYQATELKKKLGITPMVEIKQDLKDGFQNIKESEAVQKTNQAFKSFGSFASKKFGEVRNSSAFKSFEGKVGGAYNTVKSKVRGSQSDQEYSGGLSGPTSPDTEAASTEIDTTSPSTPKSGQS